MAGNHIRGPDQINRIRYFRASLRSKQSAAGGVRCSVSSKGNLLASHQRVMQDLAYLLCPVRSRAIRVYVFQRQSVHTGLSLYRFPEFCSLFLQRAESEYSFLAFQRTLGF